MERCGPASSLRQDGVADPFPSGSAEPSKRRTGENVHPQGNKRQFFESFTSKWFHVKVEVLKGSLSGSWEVTSAALAQASRPCLSEARGLVEGLPPFFFFFLPQEMFLVLVSSQSAKKQHLDLFWLRGKDLGCRMQISNLPLVFSLPSPPSCPTPAEAGRLTEATSGRTSWLPTVLLVSVSGLQASWPWAVRVPFHCVSS